MYVLCVHSHNIQSCSIISWFGCKSYRIWQNYTSRDRIGDHSDATPLIPEFPHRMCQFKYVCRVVATQLRMCAALSLTAVNTPMPYHTRIIKTFYIDNLIGWFGFKAGQAYKCTYLRGWVRYSVGNFLLGVQHLCSIWISLRPPSPATISTIQIRIRANLNQDYRNRSYRDRRHAHTWQWVILWQRRWHCVTMAGNVGVQCVHCNVLQRQEWCGFVLLTSWCLECLVVTSGGGGERSGLELFGVDCAVREAELSVGLWVGLEEGRGMMVGREGRRRG